MKKIANVILVLVLGCVIALPLLAQGNGDPDKIWSKVEVDPNSTGNTGTVPKWIPTEPVTKYYDFNGDQIIVEPNKRPHPTTNTTQSETSVDVHPSDNNIIFCSANATTWPVTTIYGTGVYWSLDGWDTWTGFDNPPFGQNSGDPVSIIGVNGYFYENYISGPGGQGVARSTNNGSSWTTYTVAPNPGSLADKNHMMIDKKSGSPYENNLYCSWTDFGGTNDNDVVLRFSTNFGQNWSSPSINLSNSLNPGSHAQGTNVQTGPNGEILVTYAIYDAWPGGEDAIGFSRSTDGGTTWTHNRIYSAVNFGIRGNLSSKNSIRVASFPVMAVDRSGGPYNGYIYICWPQRGVTPAGTDPDIVLIRSTDGGTTWSSPVRVNDDPINNGKDQYFPWCTVDQATGQLMLVFYDSRDVPNNQAEVWMARSLDGGTTFENFEVSDAPHTPAPISGLAGGYAGDYIGVAAHNDIAYPYWGENRTGIYQGWMTKVSFGAPCPVDPPTNPSPANGATDVSINLAQISWTNGAGATQCEVWFGEAGNMTLQYSGSLITSWNVPGPLTYFTDYNWRIKGKNDTCTVAGPVWSFKTEQDPNLVIDTICVYPQSVNYWTGTCNASTKTQVSYVNAVGNDVGWMVFDITSIPSNATIDGITFTGYVYSNNWPYWSITPMGTINPLTATASQINSYVSNNYQQGTAYSYNEEPGDLPIDWLNRTLEANAVSDLQNNLAQGWFALGIVDWDFSATYFIDFEGWAQTHIPYLCVVYHYIVPVELTSFTAAAEDDAVKLSWATATETNNQGFEIERRTSDGTYEKIGYVAGFGTTTEPKAYSYTDESVNTGSYTYRLKQLDFDGNYEYSDEVNVEVSAPLEYSLEQNYPNPFNPSTTIKYSVAKDGFVKLIVYNALGEQVVSLVNQNQKAGRYEVVFNADNLSSGVYLYRLETANFTSTRKLMLLR